MDDTLEELIIAVRADTSAFRRDIAGLRMEAEGPLADGFARASLTLERGLVNAVRSGRTGFDDLKRVALAALAEIAASAIRSGIASLSGGGQSGGQAQGGAGGLLGAITQIAAAFAGSGRVSFDDATRSGRFEGNAADKRTQSRVKGAADFSLAPGGAGTVVQVRVDYALTGSLAQFSRGGIVRELASAGMETSGLEIDSVSISGLDQASREFFNPNNAFDAEGLTKLNILEINRGFRF